MTRMFTFNSRRMVTWNLFSGCNFACTYCWARKLAEKRLKNSYPNGFVCTTHPDRFNRHFSPNDFVFVCSMGDISFAPSIVHQTVLDHVDKYQDTKFLLCTKDPSLYKNKAFYRPNLYLGTTIETNRNICPFSKAPETYERYQRMALLPLHKFLSIEPVMDFDTDIFINWIKEIQPEIVEIGADNYKNNLPEPPANKLRELIADCKQLCPTVILKSGIERLTNAETNTR